MPTEQVKQITLGLIYKFMSDIDEENKEFGGKSFFTGDYEKYSWQNIMDRSLSSYDRVALYAEGLERMSFNPDIPQLFRDIFRGAFLPFRDPSAVDQFLKGINDFHYEHSEDLGDAFEYLLSVMGAQGDTGQFRTPRHIIDFIVKAVDPQKTDKILDPACGTAGFLISAYKHILEQNTVTNSNHPGSALSMTEKNQLYKNFTGYDISHDMVRISLVNMYLHQFSDPKIHEHDTLTTDDNRWNDSFDCILANPPFMTPKGGIRPHNRFSIRANRSEVLFVDYMMEHLTPNGRAGYIVPEGIIFQSANAYKALRKMLVDAGFLYAVVSLPGGIFNPYSGVKTTILLVDRALAKRTDDVLFVKAENDGHDLGVQRKEISKNDLPQALEIIRRYKQAILMETDPNSAIGDEDKGIASVVSKSKIAGNGDYNFSAERYRVSVSAINHKWQMVELSDICEINPSKEELNNLSLQTEVSFVPMSNLREKQIFFDPFETRFISEVINGYTYFRDGDVLLAKITPCFENGKSGIAKKLVNSIGFGSTEFIVLRPNTQKIITELIYYFVSDLKFIVNGQKLLTGSAGQKRLPVDFVRTYKIPLPPIEVQREIVAELDRYQSIINGARQVIASYKPQIKIDPSWEMIRLEEITDFIDYRGKTPEKTKDGVRLITAKNVKMCYISEEPKEYIDESEYSNWMTRGIPKKGDVLITTEAPLGNVAQLDTDNKVAFAQRIIILKTANDQILSAFLCYALATEQLQKAIQNRATGSTVQGIKASELKQIKVPIPSLEIQKQIVAQIEEEQKLVDANRRLIEIFEQKIKDKLTEIWGE